MTKQSYVVIGLTIIALLYFFFNNTIGTSGYNVVVKYKDNLINYRTFDKKEIDLLRLKDNNDCLFFDGEYFFDQAPSQNIKPHTKVNLIKVDNVVFDGDFDLIGFIGCIIGIFMIGAFVLMIVNSDGGGDYYYD